MQISKAIFLFAILLSSCADDKMERKNKAKEETNEGSANNSNAEGQNTNQSGEGTANTTGGSSSTNTTNTNNNGGGNTEGDGGGGGEQNSGTTNSTTTTITTTTKNTLSTKIQLAGAKNHFCAISAGGKLYCWGSNNARALGDGTEVSREDPVRIGNASDWTSITAGNTHSCGIRSDKLYCWGSNAQGQIGKGNVDTHERIDSPLRIGDDANWSSVAAGAWHTCALNKAGEIYCWGTNYFGQAGDGTTNSKYVPTKVNSDKDWVSLHLSPYHHTSCGLKKSGKLYCWGKLLKDGDYVDVLRPERYTDKLWKEVSFSEYNACGIDDKDDLYCWGGTKVKRKHFATLEPTKVSGSDKWHAVTIGGHSAHAIKSDGSLHCWGYNTRGACGLGSETEVSEPEKVGKEKWLKVASNQISSCALRSDSTLWCSGQLLNIDSKTTTMVKKDVDLTK